MKVAQLFSNKSVKEIAYIAKEKGRHDLALEWCKSVVTYRTISKDCEILHKRLVKAYGGYIKNTNNDNKRDKYHELEQEFKAMDSLKDRQKLKCQQLYGLALV